jgi:hypothetical protein
MAELATFKSPSKIEFVVNTPKRLKKPRLKDAKRGETFLWQADHGRHDPAICMLTSVSAYRALVDAGVLSAIHKDVAELLSDAIWITNLQTGRTFVVQDCEIEYVKVKMIVEGV